MTRSTPNSAETASASADACKVCGGPFASKRIIIDGAAYHERCSYMSYPPHTHEDYARLSDAYASQAIELERAQKRIEELEGAARSCREYLVEVTKPSRYGNFIGVISSYHPCHALIDKIDRALTAGAR